MISSVPTTHDNVRGMDSSCKMNYNSLVSLFLKLTVQCFC